jgi:hypothetical protein
MMKHRSEAGNRRPGGCLAGDEFAISLSSPRDRVPEAEQLAERLLHAVTRPMEAEGRLEQVGAIGIPRPIVRWPDS